MCLLLAMTFGVLLGVAVTFGGMTLSSNWYTYRTIDALSSGQCIETIPPGAEIVPHQPNPCHYRRPRWSLSP